MVRNLVGDRFGRLTVIKRDDDYVQSSGKRRARWLCICECGNQKIIIGENLTRGLTKSCGCLQKQRCSESQIIHGDSDSRLYNVWRAIKGRCYNENVKQYRLYGGRGITMCNEWKEDYVAFRSWAIENGYYESNKRGECTTDRIDNDGSYSPSNCRWVTQQEQMNNVSYNHLMTCNGETRSMAEWSRVLNIPYYTLQNRLKRYGEDPIQVLRV